MRSYVKQPVLVANKCDLQRWRTESKLSVQSPYLCVFCPLDDSYELNMLRQLNVNNYTWESASLHDAECKIVILAVGKLGKSYFDILQMLHLINHIKSSGNYMYQLLQHKETLHVTHTVILNFVWFLNKINSDYFPIQDYHAGLSVSINFNPHGITNNYIYT